MSSDRTGAQRDASRNTSSVSEGRLFKDATPPRGTVKPMRFVRKAGGNPAQLGILAGAFHPPTRAHLALAQAALDTQEAGEVLFVLPERFPHKAYEGVPLEDRLAMVLASAQDPRMSVGVSQGGLFLDIARECRAVYGPETRLRFLCGRDAAERIVDWDYGDAPPIERQLAEYELLVAPRQGPYEPPPALCAAIAPLAVDCAFDEVSSTEVRQAIAAGRPWEHLVPAAIVETVRRLY